jgi:hypothetical protein
MVMKPEKCYKFEVAKHVSSVLCWFFHLDAGFSIIALGFSVLRWVFQFYAGIFKMTLGFSI